MIHSIDTVAQNRFLDPAIAQQVAQQFQHVIPVGRDLYVDTWYCNDFVAEVKKAQGSVADNARIRQEQLEKRYGRA